MEIRRVAHRRLVLIVFPGQRSEDIVGKTGIPRGLPECELIEQLAQKARQRTDTKFDFLGTLERFRKHVSGQVRHINELFPEYTPHDEEYHLKRLFHAADTVLGKDNLQEMNSAELLVLAIGLYGHDWGMAVSQAEREFILTGKLPEGSRTEDFCLLADEAQRLLRFARQQGLEVDDEGRPSDMAIELWREYVRETHADRSGARVRSFFEQIDGGLADGGARVCLGHWLDLEDLEDHRSYPADFSVRREPVNLRALAIYVRLIDLLDLAEDRTPYVIWKYVAPRDPQSKMEWEKHRALRPVTCAQYQEGRVVVVDGSTGDHEVFAALEDLRIWCEHQLRGCRDLLARMNDQRHRLDLYDIVWRVAPRGFEPVSIQFEFDREQMFEILGDEIYQGDPYVFLRELLQNSIDAIRMRREMLDRQGTGAGTAGVIRVTVEHCEKGDAKITWQDDGMGMDEYIVRDYLAVAGRSYYRSADFEREGLEMDPISRFGIGILSCFMVADRVEIDTYRDPYFPPVGEPLSIKIPAMRRQFRIEKRPREGANVGTTVTVFVSGRKLPRDEEGRVQPLDATKYLGVVAGFVDFPIVITQGDHTTIILHPDRDAGQALERFSRELGEECEVHQLDLGFPWSDVFLAQDVPTARQLLREERRSVPSDLNLEGYDGVVSYLVPSDDAIDTWSLATNDFDTDGVRFVTRYQAEGRPEAVRWRRVYDPEYAVPSMGMSPSSARALTHAVYRGGILLATASPRASLRWRYESALPPPRLVVNIPKSRAPRVDLARSQLLDEDRPWDADVHDAYLRRTVENSLEDLLTLEPSERLYQLGRICAFHNVHPGGLWQVFPHDRWPVPFLERGGRLAVREWGDVRAEALVLAPKPLRRELARMLAGHWLRQRRYNGPLESWVGEPLVICPERLYAAASHSTEQAARLWPLPLAEGHCLGSIRFVTAPWGGNPPLLEMIQVPVRVSVDTVLTDRVLEQAVADPTSLSREQWALLPGQLFRGARLGQMPDAIDFPPPFEESFAYGGEMLNLRHPAAQSLVRFAAALELAERRRALPKDLLGRLDDALQHVLSATTGSHFIFDWDDFSAAMHAVWDLAGDLELDDFGKLGDLLSGPEIFVPRSVPPEPSSDLRRLKQVRPFGEGLS
jgi:hypothetical protein